MTQRVHRGAHFGIGEQADEGARVEPSWFEQNLAHHSAEFSRGIGHRNFLGRQNVTHERVAVGVEAARGHGNHDIAACHAFCAQQVVGLNSAHRRSCHVVVVGAQQAGVLRSFAAHERRARLGARARNTGHDAGDALGHHLAARDVVGHEQGARATDHDVVDHHAHEVLADGVVLVECLRDGHLGAHAIGAGGQQGAVKSLEERNIKESGESADATEHLGRVGGLYRRLHELDGEVARSRIDSSLCVRVCAHCLPSLSARGVADWGRNLVPSSAWRCPVPCVESLESSQPNR